MKPENLGKPLLDSLSGRFLLIGYLPTFCALFFILVLLWAGAPGAELRFPDAWRTAAGLKLGEALLIVLASIVLAMVTHPLQLSLVRVLEGAWPAWLGSGVARRRQRRARVRLEARAAVDQPMDGAALQRKGAAAAQLRRRFPSEGRLRPTALGNALAAMEERAGQPYGWDAVVTWPRLYLCLGEASRTVVDDRRNALDLAARCSVMAAIMAVGSIPLTIHAGPWVLLAAVPGGLAALAYAGAIRAATAYAEAVVTAFDLHRFDLVGALHLPLPADQESEQEQAKALCLLWRQNISLTQPYQHECADAPPSADT